MNRTDERGLKAASRAMAVCGLCAALIVVLMTLGSAFGILTYVCPLLSGILVLLVLENYGPKYALSLWGASGLLALMLVPDREMAAVFAAILGWYPIAKPHLDKLPRPIRPVCKGLIFNGIMVALYLAPLYVLTPEVLGLGAGWENIVLLVMGNLILFLYDRALGRLTHTLLPRLNRLLPRN